MPQYLLAAAAAVVQAEFLLRAIRKWDEDAVPDPEAVAFGEVRGGL
jgi:hypothetical protein